MDTKAVTKSWKTTAAAVIAVFLAALAQLHATWDASEITTADWSQVVPPLVLAVGLIFARDSDVSSEDSGAK